MADFSTLTFTTPEFWPDDSIVDVGLSDLVSSGSADEVPWSESQAAVDESAIALASVDHSSTSHTVISGVGYVDSSVNAFGFGVVNLGNANIKPTVTINDAAHDPFSIDQARTSNYYPATDVETSLSHDQTAPDFNTSSSLVLTTVNTSGVPEPVSLSPSVEKSFASVSSQSPDLFPLCLNQNQWFHPGHSANSSLPANKQSIPTWHDDTPRILDAQQQTSTGRSASMESATFPDPNQSKQQYMIPLPNQGCDMELPSGLARSAGADRSNFASGYELIAQTPYDLPIRADSFERGNNFTHPISSYDFVDSHHVNLPLDAVRPCSELSIPDADPRQVLHNEYAMNHHTANTKRPLPLWASSNAWVPYTNGNACASTTSDAGVYSQETYPAYSSPKAQTLGPTTFALPEVGGVKRKSALSVYGPGPLAPKRLRRRDLVEASEFYSGYSCFTISPQGSNVKRSNVRRGKPRTKEEQNARDNGVCPPCRRAKLGCIPNDPNDPYGPCQRCVSKSDRAKMHLRGYYLTACHRSFADFSEILQPQLECRAIYKPLYLSCIRIRPMLEFLDHALTGKASDKLTLVTSLRTCMILATLHKFCRQTSDQVYRQFSKMALWYWSKACENLANAYDTGMTMEDTFELLVQVAAAFANHLNERAVNQGLPRGLLNTTVLNAELARQAWSGYEARELWYLSVNDKIPLRLPPGLVRAIAGGLEVLPKWLHEQDV